MCFRTIAVSILWLGPTVSVLAQNHPAQFPWFATAQAFITRFPADADYDAGGGVAVALGRAIAHDRLALVLGASHARATKSLVLIDGAHETGATAYHVFWGTRAALQPTRILPLTVFVELQSGWLHLRPRAFRFMAGTLGEVTIQPPSESKFAPAWSTGMQWRLTARFSALAQVKQHFFRIAIFEPGRSPARESWRPFWHWGAGLSAAF